MKFCLLRLAFLLKEIEDLIFVRSCSFSFCDGSYFISVFFKSSSCCVEDINQIRTIIYIKYGLDSDYNTCSVLDGHIIVDFRLSDFGKHIK